MPAEKEIRKLAAIMHADVKGYSRLMGEDESYTVRTLTECRKLFAETIGRYDGRVVNAPGDSILAEFPSAVSAVQCAVEIQEKLKIRNADLPYDRKMEFRIGINLGDVIESEDAIYGDGVNIAARIEALAEPGGVSISQTVFSSVQSKLGYGYEYQGEHLVKNIVNPIQIYKLLAAPTDAGKLVGGPKPQLMPSKGSYLAVVTVIFILATITFSFYHPMQPNTENAPADKIDLGQSVFPSKDKPSIAVLPFDNMTGDSEQRYFCDGMSEQIITALSQSPYLCVTSRTSSFAFRDKAFTAQQIAEQLKVQYLLEGSVQKSEDQLRINVQLIDGQSGHDVWAEHYDRKYESLFEVQDEITMKILAILNIEVTGFTSASLKNVRPSNLKAYEYFLKGLYYHLSRQPDDIDKARAACEEAVRLDPDFAKAYALLGFIKMDEITIRRTKTPEKSFRKAEEMYHKALELDPEHPAYPLMSYICREKGDFKKAIFYGEKGVEQDPNDPYRYYFLGVAQRVGGQYEDAVVSTQAALKLVPFRPINYLNNLGWAYVYKKQSSTEAIKVFNEVIDRGEKSMYGFFAYLGLAAAYELNGDHEKAVWAAENVMEKNPKFSLARLRAGFRSKDTPEKDMVYDAWRRAGLK